MSKSLLLTVAVAVAAVLLWWWSRADTRAPTSGNGASVPSTGVSPVEAGIDRRDAAAQSARPVVRQTVATPAAVVFPGETGPGPTEVCGHVVDAGSQHPVAGAEVELQRRAADETLFVAFGEDGRATSQERTRTDRDGRFAFSVAPAHSYRVVVRAAGYASKTAYDLVGGARVTIQLSAAASVTGVVTSGDLPVVDAEVGICSAPYDVELARVRTDTRGAFRIDGLPAERLRLFAVCAQHQPVGRDLQLAPGQVQSVRIDLPRGDTCRGRVLDADTSAPIQGAEVADSWSFQRAVRTDANGTFDLGGLDALLTPAVYVRAAGHVPSSLPVRLGPDAAPIEIRLPRGSEVVGRFVDVRGRPLPEARAVACSSFSNARPSLLGMCADWMRAAVATDGHFLLPPLGPDRAYWLWAQGEGFGTRIVPLPILAAGSGRIDLGDVVLEPAARIEGRVLDIAGAQRVRRVSLTRADGDFGRPLPEAGIGPTLASRCLPTDARGGFRFTGLAAGWYELHAQSSEPMVTLRARVEVKRGELRDDVVLTRRGIAGHLLAGPRFVAGHVWIETANGTLVADTQSDEQGWFWFEVAPDFRGRLHASVPGDDELWGYLADVAAGQDVGVALRRR